MAGEMNTSEQIKLVESNEPTDMQSRQRYGAVLDNRDKESVYYNSVVYDLARCMSRPGGDFGNDPLSNLNSRRILGWLGGVFATVALAQFSTNLFLRVGFVVGQTGLLLALVQFVLAYFILFMTILSICAISTNGAVEGGGAYFMISRALGPEFGGSIGFLFFLANIFSCAMYISGFVEGFVDNFGPGGILPGDAHVPAGTRWWNYLYATIVLGFCLVVCLIGGAMFARTSVFILAIVIFCTCTVIISAYISGKECVGFPSANPAFELKNNTNFTGDYCNATDPKRGGSTMGAYYTGLDLSSFKQNLLANYTLDYATGHQMTFFTVFAVLFSSVTGIMNGANMSGELINPSHAIPLGTFTAATFTCITYITMTFITAFTSSRALLVNNYNYLMSVNMWSPFVIIGIFAATLSAALGNLIGASRILEALARDKVFWNWLNPVTKTTKSGNPIIAVLVSWILVQLVLLIGSLNSIAPITSIFFLFLYASTNLACLALELASAPNFRPRFEYFSWHTCASGLVGCVVMCFLIDAVRASIALVMCFVLFMGLHLRAYPQTWGSISQALIFHQVRKYLLMLDIRKEHIKFWRPQMLYMVSNPRSSPEAMTFINDIKKGGLYVLGHVKIGNLDRETVDPCVVEYPRWLTLIDTLKLKAFVELTLSSTVREGMHHLIRLSGLGGMKPNTICLGFYDEVPQQDTIMTHNKRPQKKRRLFSASAAVVDDSDARSDISEFAPVRGNNKDKLVNSLEYIGMLQDIAKMKKNLCLFRYFQNLDKEVIVHTKAKQYIDVWPVNFFRPESSNFFDSTCLFLLQLACILHMVPAWRKHTILRVMVCVEEEAENKARKRAKLKNLLEQLRILAEIKLVPWQSALSTLTPQPGAASADAPTPDQMVGPDPKMPAEYLSAVNQLLRSNSGQSAVVFLYLPKVPMENMEEYNFLPQLQAISDGLPPTVLVHGIHPVTSTTL